MRKQFACVVIGMLALAASANASPIVGNGDFEANVGLAPGGWSVYPTIPGGWYTSSGSGIEIENNTIVTAHSGSQYVELDSNSNSSMTQDLTGLSGAYLLSFWYQPRTPTPGDNGISVFFNSVLLGTVDGTNPPTNFWQQYVFPVTSLGGIDHLKFEATGLDNSLGGFIDDVSMDQVAAPVPEPATLTLSGIGLAALIRRRRLSQIATV